MVIEKVNNNLIIQETLSPCMCLHVEGNLSKNGYAIKTFPFSLYVQKDRQLIPNQKRLSVVLQPHYDRLWL